MSLNSAILISTVFLKYISSFPCVSEAGIKCECAINQNNETQISNCHRLGGWSNWSKWSQCRNGTRKRRRICNNPFPIDSTCPGATLEKKHCFSAIPEHIFGTWTEWNEWSICDCNSNSKIRTRECRGISCDGCGSQNTNCSPNECPDTKKWTKWTEWSNQERTAIRYSAFCVSSNSRDIHVEIRNETRPNTAKASWSEWIATPSIAYRYRFQENSKIDLEHHLISRSTSTIHLHFVIPLCCSCILLGFLTQCLATKITQHFKHQEILSLSFDSNPNDYPSHLYNFRSPHCKQFRDETRILE